MRHLSWTHSDACRTNSPLSKRPLVYDITTEANQQLVHVQQAETVEKQGLQRLENKCHQVCVHMVNVTFGFYRWKINKALRDVLVKDQGLVTLFGFIPAANYWAQICTNVAYEPLLLPGIKSLYIHNCTAPG